MESMINSPLAKCMYYKYYNMTTMMSIVQTVLYIPFCLSSSAHFYDKKAEGWHWYEPTPIIEPEPSPEEENKASPSQSLNIPSQSLKEKAGEELKAFKKDLKERLELAVMYPSHTHIRAYMEKQQQMMERGELFAKRWMEVLFMTPSLDYSLKHPWSQKARHIFLEEKQKETKTLIKKLSKTYGLFFFFEAGCPYCQAFAPIVKHFSEDYGWDVLAISMDGSMLKEFKEARPDNGTARVLGVSVLPTLLAVDPQKGKVIPLSYGMNSIDHIEDRVRALYQEEEDK